MSEPFRLLGEDFWVSPQIAETDVEAAAAKGVALIINNRPDGEEPGQPAGASIERAAAAAGVSYVAIPVSGMAISEADLDRFDAAIAGAGGPVLAYCRSGARSTVMRALARARAGISADVIIAEALEAGYDIAGLRPRLEAMARD